ncbi:GNAT family N-acetyltransferase [Limibaculum sp. FT325]|uniref:GNAT family N-acetyltransferase n=1 Tax=Thermohalobaculum sediminis TaxID=2939436 RepID=UPI0020C12E0D|nr:GNAT family N-acetyltransferase [Limibaculum sediminis]MCL5778858.1 GNAT family N-acetyltransferase [Limibaculum sediminis]
MRPQAVATKRLILRPLRPSDAGPMTLYASDPRVARMTTSIPHPYPPGAAESYIDTRMNGRIDEAVWAIDATPEGGAELIGLIVHRPRTGKIGYWVGPPFWNTGFASEALGGLIAHLLASGEETLTASVIAENAASAHVLEKAGFAETGTGEMFSVARGSMVPVRRFALDRAGWMEARRKAGTSDEVS